MAQLSWVIDGSVRRRSLATSSQISLTVSLALILAASLSLAQQNSELMDELIRMGQIDQGGREEINRIEQEHGYDSFEWKAAWERQRIIDAEHMTNLELIIEEHGWPMISMVGDEAARAAFFIVQHSDLGHQKKYLPLIRDAALTGEAAGESYAMLQDRVLMSEGKRQLYGSQTGRNDATGRWYVWPIEDEEAVDERRAALGMSTLAEYLQGAPPGIELEPAPEGLELDLAE